MQPARIFQKRLFLQIAVWLACLGALNRQVYKNVHQQRVCCIFAHPSLFSLVIFLFFLFFSGIAPDKAECFSATEKLESLKSASMEYIAGLQGKRFGVKSLNQWREAYEKATQAIKEAELAGADRYAESIYSEAIKHYELAKKYALKRSYSKARYLALKAEKEAQEGTKKATEYFKAQKDRMFPFLQEIALLMQKANEEERNTRRWRELILDYQNVIHHIKLEEFEMAIAEIAILKQKIEAITTNGNCPEKITVTNQET